MSRGTSFPTSLHVRWAKTQISLRICAVWSESSPSEWRRIWCLATNRVLREDSDQQADLNFRLARLQSCTKYCMNSGSGLLYMKERNKKSYNNNYAEHAELKLAVLFLPFTFGHQLFHHHFHHVTFKGSKIICKGRKKFGVTIYSPLIKCP